MSICSFIGFLLQITLSLRPQLDKHKSYIHFLTSNENEIKQTMVNIYTFKGLSSIAKELKLNDVQINKYRQLFIE